MKKMIFFIIFGVCGFSLLAFLASRFSGIWLGVEIFVLLALFLIVSMTRTERLGRDNASPAPAPQATDSEPEPASPSSPDAGKKEGASSTVWWVLVVFLVVGGIVWVSWNWHSEPVDPDLISTPLLQGPGGRLYISFYVPQKWRTGGCFESSVAIDAKIVTEHGRDVLHEVSPRTARCWQKARHFTFRLARMPTAPTDSVVRIKFLPR